MKRTAMLLCLLLIAACGGSSGQSRTRTPLPTGTPAAAATDATYFCPLADRPYSTTAERAAGLKEAERLFQQRRGFPNTDRNRAIGKAATQVLAALQGGDHSRSKAEVDAGVLALPDALQQLRKACSG